MTDQPLENMDEEQREHERDAELPADEEEEGEQE